MFELPKFWLSASVSPLFQCQTLRDFLKIHHGNSGKCVAFFATGPGLGLIMYILTTLEFSTHYFDIHLLTTSVNAKYYY